MQPPQSNYGAPAPKPNYDFIMQPPQRPRKLPFNNSSPVARLLLVVFALLILLIAFIIIKNSFSSDKSSLPAMISVMQQQQEIIHLTTNNASTATPQTALSTANQNFATTTQLSLGSAQSQLLAYLKNNHHKVGAKTLGQKVNLALDKQLTAAAAASTYNQTFDQIMQNQLSTYEIQLAQAYKLTAGPKGKALLKSEYAGAQLLLKQLNTPST